MAEIEALSIELVREIILGHVSKLDDLKSLSLLNSEWNSQAQEFMASKSNFVLGNQDLITFVYNLENHGWKRKLGMVSVDYWAHCYEDRNVAEDLEALSKLEPYINKLYFQIEKRTTPMEIFKVLTVCKNVEKLELQFEFWDSTEQIPKLEELFEVTPLAFPNLKQLKILGYYSTDGWDFSTEFLLPAIPDCCKTIELNGEAEYVLYFLENLAEIPGKLEQFENIKIPNCSNNEIWELLNVRNLFLLEKATIYVTDKDVDKATIFLKKYKAQLKSLAIRFKPPLGTLLNIPEMKNLEDLYLFWYTGKFEDAGKFAIRENKSGESFYPKLRKLRVFTDDMEILMPAFRYISNNGGIGKQLTTVTATFQLDNKTFIKWYKEEKENCEKELEELFPNAQIELDNEKLKSPETLSFLLMPNYKQRFLNLFGRICWTTCNILARLHLLKRRQRV